MRLAARAVVAPGQAARLVPQVDLRAGKLGAPLELAVARPGLGAASLAQPVREALRAPPVLSKAEWRLSVESYSSRPTIAAPGEREGEGGTRREH